MKTLKQLFPILLLLLVYPIVGFSQKEKKKKGLKSLISLEIPSSIEWRSIGPFRGGRASSVAGVVGQPNVYYFGATEEVFGKLKMVGNHGKIYQMVILEVQLEQSQLVYLIQI